MGPSGAGRQRARACLLAAGMSRDDRFQCSQNLIMGEQSATEQCPIPGLLEGSETMKLGKVSERIMELKFISIGLWMLIIRPRIPNEVKINSEPRHCTRSPISVRNGRDTRPSRSPPVVLSDGLIISDGTVVRPHAVRRPITGGDIGAGGLGMRAFLFPTG